MSLVIVGLVLLLSAGCGDSGEADGGQPPSKASPIVEPVSRPGATVSASAAALSTPLPAVEPTGDAASLPAAEEGNPASASRDGSPTTPPVSGAGAPVAAGPVALHTPLPRVEASWPRDVSAFDLFSGSSSDAAALTSSGVATVEEVLEKGLRLAGASPVHLAVRGAALADSIRCEWRGIARTPEQREGAVRFWLGLDADDEIPDASYLEALFTITLDTIGPEFRETAKSNFLAIARGGVSTEYLFLTCYAGYAVAEYLLGGGPTTLTLAYDRMGEVYSYELYRREHDAGQFGDEPLKSEGEHGAELNETVWAAESSLSDIIEGRQGVLFLAPMGAHNAIAVEAWQVVAQWDVQRSGTSTVAAVRYGASEGDPEHTQTLANLKSRVTTATAATSTATTTPARIASVGGLRQYYRDIGAYGDITPDDGETTTFTPGQLPPVPTCAGVDAVPGPRLKPGLVRDCTVLLDTMDTLAGTATLDWSATTTISSWEGVTLNASSTRVTALDLDDEGLDGSIPPELGGLFELTTLDLSTNSLTGEIPAELVRLSNLEEIRLSGNRLTGCIPIALEDVATNDLASLGLLYCEPPAPRSLRADAPGETSIGLHWDAVANAGTYRVEYRAATSTVWSVDVETSTTTVHTVDGLTCGSGYDFRVSAYGSGVTYAAAWSAPSAVLSESAAECAPPAFDVPSYTFAIAEDVAVGTVVGTVSATDAGGGAVTYSITGGNEEGAFAIATSTGAITVAGPLDYGTTASYGLTVIARDITGSAALVGVAISIIDVAGDYDRDDDGLIEVSSLAQLNAIRWDLDGNGVPGSNTSDYRAAFPDARARMGCLSAGCTGYELTADLDFDTDGSGTADSGDDYWNNGRGWVPIGDPTNLFGATVEGNGHTISNLFIDRASTNAIGLFRYTASTGVIRNVGLLSANVTGRDSVGGLVGYNLGSVANSYATGSVTGAKNVGGLLGNNYGPVTKSYSAGNARGDRSVGGLVGYNYNGTVTASYATGNVTSGPWVGGLVGRNYGTVTASYATGNVTGSSSVGGLVGYNYNGTVTASYWDTGASGQSTSAGGVGKTTGELRSPTASTGIYSTWGSAAWDFGTSRQYPVLKADFDGDSTATWRELGPQRSVPGAPEGLTAAAGDAQATLTWTPPGDNGSAVTGHQYTHDGGITWTDVPDSAPGGANAASSTVTGLTNGTAYTFQVRGVNDVGVGEASNAATATPVGAPAAPEGLTAAAGDGEATLSWTPASDNGSPITGHQYTRDGGATWTDIPDSAPGEANAASFTVAGLTNGAAYTFQVRAVNGVGEGAASPSASATPDSPPVFDAPSYAFSVPESATTTASVGTVSATDSADDMVTYSITAGNQDGKFAIDGGTGEITGAGALDHETTPTHTLTVEASDVSGGASTSTVSIAVTDVPEDLPPAPGSVTASLVDGEAVSVSWDPVPGADLYEAEYLASGSEEGWTSLGSSTSTSAALRPSGGLLCGTAYELRVRARGDGAAYAAEWGPPSETVSVATEACNRDPEFATSTYSFSIAEDAATTTPVGAVSATDPDEGDTVTYAITAGNEDGKFAVDGSTGEITVAGALDHETAPAYTLTVEASDGNGGASTAAVSIAVTDVLDTPPPAPRSLRVAAAGRDSLTLAWDPLQGTTSYELEYKPSPAEGWMVVDVSETSTSSGLTIWV